MSKVKAPKHTGIIVNDYVAAQGYIKVLENQTMSLRKTQSVWTGQIPCKVFGVGVLQESERDC